MRISVDAGAGEIVDKLTILDIKLERIADPDKRANVARQREALLPAWSAIVAAHQGVRAMLAQGP